MTGIPPEPEPSGSLIPPIRRPPTAVGLATPPAPEHSRAPQRRAEPRLLRFIRRLAIIPLELADALVGAMRRLP